MAARVARRTALVAAATGAGSIALPGAAAATRAPSALPTALPQPARYTITPVPSKALRHLLSRFSYGTTPQLRAQARIVHGSWGWSARRSTEVPAQQGKLGLATVQVLQRGRHSVGEAYFVVIRVVCHRRWVGRGGARGQCRVATPRGPHRADRGVVEGDGAAFVCPGS